MKLLLIGDDRKTRRMFAWGFAAAPYRVKLACTRRALEVALASENFQAACIDLKMQEEDPAAMLQQLRRRSPGLPVVALVSASDRKAEQMIKEHGVTAVLTSPFAIESLHTLLRETALPTTEPAIAPLPEPVPTASRTPFPAPAPKLTFNDDAARRTVELAMRAANSNAAILILGETGTGKTQLAQTIHQNSPIRAKPFVTVNCPCLSHELLESDLFGHVRGAFTGAVQDTWGKVSAADGGTLFLDEIGDLPMSLQPKLLRLLQEKQYERVGEATSRTANVRIVAATNRDLKREVAAGRFREDLYYRLNVIAIEVPPLRGRPSQILGAADVFLDAICQQLGKPKLELSLEARRLLEMCTWSGNLRELRNVVERAAILSSGSVLHAADFPSLQSQPAASPLQVGAAISLHALETAHIQMVVASSSSLEEAARILEIDKSTLYRKRKLMEADVAVFSPQPEPAAAVSVG